MAIVAAVDFSENASGVVVAAAREARRRDTALVVSHCVELGGGVLAGADRPDGVRDQMRADALDQLQALVDETLEPTDRPEPLEFNIALMSPEEGVSEIAADREAGMVVVGRSEQEGIGAAVWGTTAENLVRTSDRMLMVVPPRWNQGAVGRILVPVTDTPEGDRSLELAAEVAGREGADVRLLYVVDPGESSTLGRDMPPSSERLASEKSDGVAMLREKAVEFDFGTGDVETVSSIRPLEATGIHTVILEEAQDWGADRIVMATRGREGVRRWLEGSVSSEVLYRTEVPLILTSLDGE